MFKKLLKAAKILTTVKATKETLSDLKQPEKDTKYEQYCFKVYKQTEELISKGAICKEYATKLDDKAYMIGKNLAKTNPNLISMKTKDLKGDTVNTPTKVDLSDSLTPSNHHFAKMLEDTPDMLETAMAEARFFANLSSCQKAKVGCAIFDDDHILSIGYNTNRSYHFSCDGSECQVAGKNDSTNCGITHAEVVAVENLELSEYYGNQKYAYVTHFPCTQCLYQLQKEGIKEVFYSDKNYLTKDLVRMNPDTTFTQV